MEDIIVVACILLVLPEIASNQMFLRLIAIWLIFG